MSLIAITSSLLMVAGQAGTLYSAGFGPDNGAPHQFFLTQPAVVEGGGPIVQAEASQRFSLALQKDGTVLAWGFNGYRQLGTGQKKTSADHPIVVPGLPKCKFVGTGTYHSLAVARNGDVWGWGYADYGQIGPNPPNKFVGTPQKIAGFAGMVSVTGGFSFSLALKNNGTVWVVGTGTSGQLGLGPNVTTAPNPIKIPGLTNVVQVVSAANYSYAVKADGTVVGWGSNFSNHLATDDTASSVWSPSPVSGLSMIKKIDSTDDSSIALRDDGQVLTWGTNESGQLGNPAIPTTYIGTSTPTFVPNLVGVKDVAEGESRTIAVLDDGSVKVAGIIEYFGLEGYSSKEFLLAKGLKNAFACTSGEFHSLVLCDIENPIWAEVVPYTVVSNDEPSTLTVHNERPSDQDLVVQLASDNANVPVPATVTIPAGESSASVQVRAIEKTWNYPTITFTVDAGEIPMTTHLSINNETARFGFPYPDPVAGSDQTLLLILNFPAPEGGQTFKLTSSDDPAMLRFPATVTVPKGKTLLFFNVHCAPSKTNYLARLKAKSGKIVAETNLIVEGSEIAAAEFLQQDVLGGTDVPLYLRIFNPAPAGGQDMEIRQGQSNLTFPHFVHFDEGETEKTVTVGTRPVKEDKSIPLTITYGSSYQVPYLRVKPPTLQSIVADLPTLQVEGGEPVTFRVEQDGISAGEDIEILSNNAALQVPTSVTMQNGRKKVEFEASTSVVDAPTFVTVKAKLRNKFVSIRLKLIPPQG